MMTRWVRTGERSRTSAREERSARGEEIRKQWQKRQSRLNDENRGKSQSSSNSTKKNRCVHRRSVHTVNNVWMIMCFGKCLLPSPQSIINCVCVRQNMQRPMHLKRRKVSTETEHSPISWFFSSFLLSEEKSFKVLALSPQQCCCVKCREGVLKLKQLALWLQLDSPNEREKVHEREKIGNARRTHNYWLEFIVNETQQMLTPLTQKPALGTINREKKTKWDYNIHQNTTPIIIILTLSWLLFFPFRKW